MHFNTPTGKICYLCCADLLYSSYSKFAQQFFIKEHFMFKKVLVALVLVVLAPTAFADSFQLGYRFDNTETSSSWDQNALHVDWMHDLKSVENVRVGFGFRRIQRNSDNRLTNRFKLKSQFRHIGGVQGLHYGLILGTKERTDKPTTQYVQTQLSYGKKFAGTDFGWQVAYFYREGIIDATKYDDHFHGPRVQFNWKASDDVTVKLALDRLYLGYNQVARDRIGLFFSHKL